MSVCICLCTILCFYSHDLNPCSLKEAETQWEPLHSPPVFFFFFSLSLYVTPHQINSLLILISQEITYWLYLTLLLFLFLFALTEQAHILSHAFFSLSFCLSFRSLWAAHACLHTASLSHFLSLSHTHAHTCTHTCTTHTHTYKHKHMWILNSTQLMGWWIHITYHQETPCTLMHTH